MAEAGELVDVFGLDAYPTDDWMFTCDGCGIRVRADEALRGTGDVGMQYAREIMALSGWRSDASADTDLCPSCAPETDVSEEGVNR